MKQTKQPLISVIVTCWNSEKWLKKCLGSLMAQNYASLEIIVVDNGSADGSVALIKRQFPSIKLIENGQNDGFGEGNNIGIRAAKGDYIVMFNVDAWAQPSFVSDLYTFYCQHDYDVIGPIEANYEGQAGPGYISTIDPLGHPVFLEAKNNSSDGVDGGFYLSGVSLFFKKALFTASGGFDKNFFMYSEEVDWFWRLLLTGKTFAYAPHIFINHAGGTKGALLQYRIFLWRNQNVLQMLLKNYAWYNLLWTLPLYVAQNILEIIAFTILLKPKIAASYIYGWYFNVVHLGSILRQRRFVQQLRTRGDRTVLQHMYHGPGKLAHLASVLKAKRR